MTNNIMGGEPITSVEILPDQPAQQQPEQVNIQQQQVDNRIPYERFQSVVQERNAIKEQAEQWRIKYEQSLQQQAQAQVQPQMQNMQDQIPQFESTEQLIKWVDNRVEQRAKTLVEQSLKPIQQMNLQNNYKSGVQTFISSVPDAKNFVDGMRKEIDRMRPEVQAQFIKDVASGDTTMLKYIYNTVKLSTEPQANTTVTQAQAQQINTVSEPSSVRANVQMPMTVSQMMKSGQVSKVFNALARNITSGG